MLHPKICRRKFPVHFSSQDSVSALVSIIRGITKYTYSTKALLSLFVGGSTLFKTRNLGYSECLFLLQSVRKGKAVALALTLCTILVFA